MTLDRRARAAAKAERALVDQVWPPPAWPTVVARRRRRSLLAGTAVLLLAAVVVWTVVVPAVREQPVVGPVPRLVGPRPVGRVVATVRVGEGPNAVVAGGGVVWVAGSLDGTVTRVDAATGRVTATVRVGGKVDGLALAGGTLWVAYADRAVVSRVDPATARVVGEVRVGRHAPVGSGTLALPEPIGVGLGAVWVANSADGTVSRIDLATGAVTTTAPLSQRNQGIHLEWAGLGVAVAGGSVWVTDAYHGRLLRLDPRTGRPVQTVEVGADPLPIQAGAGGLWAAKLGDRTLLGLDPRTGRVTSTVLLGPGGPSPFFGVPPLTPALAVGGESGWAVTTIQGHQVLVRVDLRSGRVTGRQPVGGRGRVLGLALLGGDPWLTDYDSNTLLHVVPTP